MLQIWSSLFNSAIIIKYFVLYSFDYFKFRFSFKSKIKYGLNTNYEVYNKYVLRFKRSRNWVHKNEKLVTKTKQKASIRWKS